MPRYRQWEVSYTLPGQIMQKMIVQASDINSARQIVQSMFAQVLVGYIREVTTR